MKSIYEFLWAMVVLVVAASSASGDGCYFELVGESQTTHLAQTRQEVLMAVQNGNAEARIITYVLRSHYTGDPSTFAWIIPLPVIPTDIVAHDDARLFEALQTETAPRFIIETSGGGGGDWNWGCAYGGMAGSQELDSGALVEVESSGQAGIYEYVVLSSSGSAALLDWLNDNRFAVPASADEVLQTYIDQEMHFLALRILEPETISGQDQREIPPIQFACQIARPWYPMVISQISAATETEVVIYLMAETRMQATNATEGIIDGHALYYDPASESLTNYEALFTQTLAELESPAMIVEYAQNPWLYSILGAWPQAPADLPSDICLTRLRTVLKPDEMDRDFVFDASSSSDWVYSVFYIWVSQTEVQAGMALPPVGILLCYGLVQWLRRRRTQRMRSATGG